MAKLTGTNPDQVPTNADLGDMAYKDGENLQAGPLTITDGKVGVGTTDPDKALVVSTVGAEVVIDDTDTTDTPTLRFRESGTTSSTIRTDGGNLMFTSGGSTERMRINSSGNVGVGTTNPTSNLHVSSSGDTLVRVTSADGNGAFLDLGDASDPDGGRIVYDSGSNLTFSTSSAERMRIDSSGKVGVGTTSPSDNLDVASAAPTLRLTDTDGYYSQIYGGSGSLVFRTDVGQATGGDTMQFVLSGTEAMRIDSSGNVGIGTTSPTSELHVADTGESIITVASTSAGSARVNLVGSGGGGGFVTSTAQSLYLETTTAADVVLRTNSTERMRITSTGEVDISSGLLELDGNDIGGTQVTIADDAVASITPPRKGGFMFVTCQGNSGYPQHGVSGLVFYDVGSSLFCARQDPSSDGGVGDGLLTSTSDVTGTTGTDGNVTVAVQSDVIKIENRHGFSRTFQITFL